MLWAEKQARTLSLYSYVGEKNTPLFCQLFLGLELSILEAEDPTLERVRPGDPQKAKDSWKKIGSARGIKAKVVLALFLNFLKILFTFMYFGVLPAGKSV